MYARPKIWPNIFICGREEGKKREGEEGKERRREERGEGERNGGPRKEEKDRGDGVHIIMDPAIEKSETSRRELHERPPLRTYLRIRVRAYVYAYTYACMYMYAREL